MKYSSWQFIINERGSMIRDFIGLTNLLEIKSWLKLDLLIKFEMTIVVSSVSISLNENYRFCLAGRKSWYNLTGLNMCWVIYLPDK